MNAMKDTQNGQKEPKDRLAFDKTDRISLLVLMGVIGAIVVARTVILPIAGWIAGDPIVLPFLSPINVPQLDAAGVDYTLGTYGVQLADPSTGQRLLDLIPGIFSAALVICGVLVFRRFMRDIGAGVPFAPGQVTRLRILGGLLIVGSPVAFFARFSFDGALVGSIDRGGLDPVIALDLPWTHMVLGSVAALLAEAFKVGARLTEDVEGLI